MGKIAAAAAKIKAQLDARKGIQHVDVPPIRSDSAASGGAAGPPGGTINGEMYIADGDYIKDIEVNDLRNRYTLTKGSTQKMVNTLPGLFLLIQTKANLFICKKNPWRRSSLAYTGGCEIACVQMKIVLFGRC